MKRLYKNVAPMQSHELAVADKLNRWTFSEITHAHLECRNRSCKKPWFIFSRTNDDLNGYCPSCQAEVVIDLATMDFNPPLPQGDLTCPSCAQKNRGSRNQYAVIVQDMNVCIGCRRCEHQHIADLRETESGLILSPH